jgi:hypothetical protein
MKRSLAITVALMDQTGPRLALLHSHSHFRSRCSRGVWRAAGQSEQ